jgi:predicted PhzF superfamily epimerase YddE/YHI9
MGATLSGTAGRAVPRSVLETWIVDAFTDVVFAGNPAAVVWLREPLDVHAMQQIAAEFNLSETAFLVPTRDPWRFELRWFTPACEVDLCGHATLASAHVVWSRGDAPPFLEFETASGTLSARRSGPLLELDFPAVPASDPAPVPGLAAAIGTDAVYVGATRQRTPEDRNALVVFPSGDALRALAPDLSALAQLPVPSLIATSPSDRDGVDFLTRYFAPAFGVDEDPVTGSAHCTAGPYWADRLGRTSLRARQESSRGGWLELEVRGDRVTLAGQAVTFLHGRLERVPGAP